MVEIIYELIKQLEIFFKYSCLLSWYFRQFYALFTVLSNRKLSSELFPISLTIPASENDEDNK